MWTFDRNGTKHKRFKMKKEKKLRRVVLCLESQLSVLSTLSDSLASKLSQDKVELKSLMILEVEQELRSLLKQRYYEGALSQETIWFTSGEQRCMKEPSSRLKKHGNKA